MYKGCACPLTVDWPQPCLHDRLGKSVIPDVDPVDISCIQPEHASIALCRLVSKDAGMNNFIISRYCCHHLADEEVANYTVFVACLGHLTEAVVCVAIKYGCDNEVCNKGFFIFFCEK